MANPTEQKWLPGKFTVGNFDYVRLSEWYDVWVEGKLVARIPKR